jgi:glutamine synthetase type III
MNREAAKMGLQVLFHEKPFAGINGSGSSVSIVDVAVSENGVNVCAPSYIQV